MKYLSLLAALAVAEPTELKVVDMGSVHMKLEYEVADGDLTLTQNVRRLTGETENRLTLASTMIMMSPLTDEEKEAAVADPDQLTRPAISGVIATYVDSKQAGTKTAELKAVCKKEGATDSEPAESCGWTEVEAAAATMYGEVVSTAKRPMDVPGFELKAGSYDALCTYNVQHLEAYEPAREAELTKTKVVTLELMDGSGAFQALAVGVTALIAALAF